jgi:hypothetical protein
MEGLIVEEIPHVFLSNSQVLSTYFQLKNSFPEVKNKSLLGVALIKNKYLLPGLRLLYRNSTIDEAKNLLENLVLTPNETASILIQAKNLNDVKLEKFSSNIGIPLKSLGEIKEYMVKFGVNEVVVNGTPIDILSLSHVEFYENSIGYYIADEGNFVVTVKGKKFILPEDLAELFEESIFISLKQMFPTGLPSERFFFLVRKVDFSSQLSTVYFDPYIKLGSLVLKIEERNFIEFFHEFLYLLYTEFGILDDERTKREIINKLVKQEMIWLLFEMKNIVSYLADQGISHDVRNLQKLLESFFEGYEYDFLFRHKTTDLVKVKILTPIIDLRKYFPSQDYLERINLKSIKIVNHKDTFLVRSEDKELDIGTINPYTARFLQELDIEILSLRVISKRLMFSENILPEEYTTWLEINGILRNRML